MSRKKFQPENVLLGTASIGLERQKVGSNEIWKGNVNVLGVGDTPAYIKRTRSNNELYTEIICAIFGRALGIPIPRPIIVNIPDEHPEIPIVKGNSFLFGSEDVGMPSFDRLIHDKSVLEEVLLDYSDIHKILAFDELIANSDRNNSNILYDGVDFRFIDHEKCISPQQNATLPIDENYKVGNISDIIKEFHNGNDVKNERLMRLVRKFVNDEVKKSEIGSLSHYCMTSKINANDHEERIQSFLAARMDCLIGLVSDSIQNSIQLDLLKSGGV